MSKEKHKPGCLANTVCAVYHSDGICPGPYGKCTCDGNDSQVVIPQPKEAEKPEACEHSIMTLWLKCEKCGEAQPKWLGELLDEHVAQARTQTLKEIREVAEGEKNRVRCARCDGAKCEHTLGCESITRVLAFIDKQLK